MITKHTSVKAVKKTDIGGSDRYSVRCQNRFEVLTHLQENWDVIDEDKGELKEYGQNTLVASSDSNTVKGKNLDNETQNSQVVIEREKTNECDNGFTNQNDLKIKVDVQNTAQIVKATLQGRKCVRNVIVTNIEDTCIDLRKCLAQQDTPLGFLPISNLKLLAIASSLRPNKVL